MTVMFKKTLPLVPALFFFILSLQAQNTGTCQADSLYHALDFWVGDWEVFDQNDRFNFRQARVV